MHLKCKVSYIYQLVSKFKKKNISGLLPLLSFVQKVTRASCSSSCGLQILWCFVSRMDIEELRRRRLQAQERIAQATLSQLSTQPSSVVHASGSTSRSPLTAESSAPPAASDEGQTAPVPASVEAPVAVVARSGSPPPSIPLAFDGTLTVTPGAVNMVCVRAEGMLKSLVTWTILGTCKSCLACYLVIAVCFCSAVFIYCYGLKVLFEGNQVFCQGVKFCFTESSGTKCFSFGGVNSISLTGAQLCEPADLI